MSPALSAQFFTLQKFTGQVGAGFTTPVSDAGRSLNTGYNISGGVGYNFWPSWGLNIDLNYNRMDINRRTLRELSFPDGNVQAWSATLNPVYRFNPDGHLGGYVTVGGGFYQRVVQFTRPTFVPVTIFDPFFGIFYPAFFPANLILAQHTVNKPGFNAGVGVTWRVGYRSRIFAEARYEHMYTSPENTAYIPVTFGIQF